MANAAVIMMMMFMMLGIAGGAGYYLWINQNVGSSVAEQALEDQLLKTIKTKQELEEQKAIDDAANEKKVAAATADSAAAAASGATAKKPTTDIVTKIHINVDNELLAVRKNGAELPMPGILKDSETCRWDRECTITTFTNPGDKLEFDIHNAGGYGMFQCLIERDGKALMTVDDFDADTPIQHVVVAAWTDGQLANVRKNMRTAKHAWTKDMCENCTVTFTTQIPTDDD